MMAYCDIHEIVSYCTKMDSETLKKYFIKTDRQQKEYEEHIRKRVMSLDINKFDLNCDFKDHAKIIAFVLRAKYPETYKEIESCYEKDMNWKLTRCYLHDLGNGYMSIVWGKIPLLKIPIEKEEKDKDETKKREQGQV